MPRQGHGQGAETKGWGREVGRQRLTREKGTITIVMSVKGVPCRHAVTSRHGAKPPPRATASSPPAPPVPRLPCYSSCLAPRYLLFDPEGTKAL
jgi:hypothetical protein